MGQSFFSCRVVVHVSGDIFMPLVLVISGRSRNFITENDLSTPVRKWKNEFDLDDPVIREMLRSFLD
jgi:hypothetical protein